MEASTEATVLPGDHDDGITGPIFELGAATSSNQNSGLHGILRVPFDILRSIIEVYRSRMYPVWPVIEANNLLSQLKEQNTDTTVYILATSLCAATMAQLHLTPIGSQGQKISSENLERECSRVRGTFDYREHPNLNHVLTSFFLHVYHAKVNNQNSALLYIQEAILLARLLKLDKNEGPCHGDHVESVVDGCLVYLLLWISERKVF